MTNKLTKILDSFNLRKNAISFIGGAYIIGTACGFAKTSRDIADYHITPEMSESIVKIYGKDDDTNPLVALIESGFVLAQEFNALQHEDKTSYIPQVHYHLTGPIGA